MKRYAGASAIAEAADRAIVGAMWEILYGYWPHILAALSLAITVVAASHAALTKDEVRAAIGWVGVILLGVAVLLLARQVGVLHERIAPIGALAMGGELRKGEPAQRIPAMAFNGDKVIVGAPPAVARAAMLLFVAPACPVCKTMIPIAMRFSQIEDVELLLVGDGDSEQYGRMLAMFGFDPARFVNSAEVGMAYRVGKIPYAVLIDRTGLVSAHGLVNTLEHLESLIVSQETGLSSIQEYLTGARPEKREAVSDKISGWQEHG